MSLLTTLFFAALITATLVGIEYHNLIERLRYATPIKGKRIRKDLFHLFFIWIIIFILLNIYNFIH